MKEKFKEYLGYILFALVIIVGTNAKDFINHQVKKNEWSIAQLQSDVERYNAIQTLMTELRIALSAERVVIYFFHNGGFFSNGMPYKKMSIAYESVKTGISPEMNNSQNLPLSQFSEALSDLLSDEDPVFRKVSDMKDSNWKFLLKNQGIESSYKTKLVIDGKIIGFVEVQYSSPNKEKNTSEISFLNSYRNRIENYVLRAL